MSLQVSNPGGGSSAAAVTVPFFPWFTQATLAASGLGVSLANRIWLFPFTLPYSQTITNFVFRLTQLDGTNVGDLGIYDTGGSLKGKTGAQIFNGSNPTTVSITPTGGGLGGAITIGPGTFLFAFTSAGTTLQVDSITAPTNMVFYYSTGTTATSGALPSSITVSATASKTVPTAFSNPRIPVNFFFT
jgi:hypothetical protein